MIWLQSLVPNEHVKISYSRGWSPSTDSHGKPQAQVVKSQIPAPSILRVSKNFHKEAEEVLYKFNVFEFKGSSAIDDLVLFLQSMSERAYRFFFAANYHQVAVFCSTESGMSNRFLGWMPRT
jgi:hypothetical protein